jgi:STIM1 Orai1-activating region
MNVVFFQCEKLKKKRSSLVGAFVSTHGKSIDDVDRSIVEARYVQAFVQVCSSFSVLHQNLGACVAATTPAAPCTSLSTLNYYSSLDVSLTNP